MGNLKVAACWLGAALGLLMVETCLMREGAWEMMSWVAKLAWEASLRRWAVVGAAQLALWALLDPFPWWLESRVEMGAERHKLVSLWQKGGVHLREEVQKEGVQLPWRVNA